MANVGVADIPNNKEWVKQMKSAPVVRATGPSEATTNRGIASITRVKKKKIG